MVPTFLAFDRSIYQELIPYHLKDMLTIPSNVMHHLRKGSFSVHLSQTEWHGVALDQCHEMRINKDAKLAVVHLTGPWEQVWQVRWLPYQYSAN